MCSKVVVSQIKRLFAYVLPFIVIVSQFIELGAIKMSWLLYLILILYAFFKLGRVLNNYLLIMLSATVCILPLLTSFWNVTGAFNSSLYISLITGLSILLYINEITQSEVQYFLRGCFAACLIFSIWGTFEVISGKYFLFENEDFIFRLNAYGRHYPGTAFTNTNDLAQYLAILLPLTSMIFWNKKFLTLHNILIILTNTLTFFVIFNSASYLGMISFVGTWMIFICGYFFKQKIL